MVQILRLLHCQHDKIVVARLDYLGILGVEVAGQVGRADAAPGGLAFEREADFGTAHVDQFSGGAATDKGHVVTRHQELGAEQRPI